MWSRAHNSDCYPSCMIKCLGEILSLYLKVLITNETKGEKKISHTHHQVHFSANFHMSYTKMNTDQMTNCSFTDIIPWGENACLMPNTYIIYCSMFSAIVWPFSWCKSTITAFPFNKKMTATIRSFWSGFHIFHFFQIHSIWKKSIQNVTWIHSMLNKGVEIQYIQYCTSEPVGKKVT